MVTGAPARVLVAVLLLGAGIADAQQAGGAAGWIDLFDGKTLQGWEARPTSVPASKGDWKVEAGALVCGGATPSWIHTTETFGDFRLTLEFRGAEKVNSGVFLRSRKEGQPHIMGYELQIWDYQPAGYNTGSLVGSLKAEPAKIVAGDWNTYDIVARGDHFRIVLNGKTLLDARDPKHSSGVIGFQCQRDNRIEFRKIRLQPIKR
jgi:hypothetical protein